LRILAVSEVTRAVRDVVRSEPELRDLWVEGEVGRVTISSAGHCYFALKDERSQLACVFFRDDRQASPFEARTGLRVVVHGRIDVFETQGVYQLYVSSIQPAGFGDLALRFEALKARLAAEGLFDSSRKRPLPSRPAVIGVVTSPTGAVWHDIRQVVGRRWPLASLVLSPCQVQGDSAPASVVAGLERLARWSEQLRASGRGQGAPAVVILARGGGSLEDLWPFNDERVVRAVVAHPVPVVCGVGHEVDVTLADFAADVRAPTPSAAAEIVVPDRAEVAAAVSALERRGRACVLSALASSRREVAAESRALERLRPAAQLAQAREQAGALLDRATRVVRNELARRRALEVAAVSRLAPGVEANLVRRRAVLDRLGASLAALGPQATLDRGYAIVRRATDAIVVREPLQAPAGTGLRIRLAVGEIAARSEGEGGLKSELAPEAGRSPKRRRGPEGGR
jgi:exodeoxyribonuclease VII large subunit